MVDRQLARFNFWRSVLVSATNTHTKQTILVGRVRGACTDTNPIDQLWPPANQKLWTPQNGEPRICRFLMGWRRRERWFGRFIIDKRAKLCVFIRLWCHCYINTSQHPTTATTTTTSCPQLHSLLLFRAPLSLWLHACPIPASAVHACSFGLCVLPLFCADSSARVHRQRYWLVHKLPKVSSNFPGLLENWILLDFWGWSVWNKFKFVIVYKWTVFKFLMVFLYRSAYFRLDWPCVTWCVEGNACVSVRQCAVCIAHVSFLFLHVFTLKTLNRGLFSFLDFVDLLFPNKFSHWRHHHFWPTDPSWCTWMYWLTP